MVAIGLPASKTVVFQGHNHPQDDNEKVVIDFLNQLKMACKSGFDLPVKSIYDSVAKM